MSYCEERGKERREVAGLVCVCPGEQDDCPAEAR